jgi:hypothetical protein
MTKVTARVAAARLRGYEVGISYSGRNYEEGKKNWLERWGTHPVVHT